MVEPEMAYADLEDVMHLAEELICTSSPRVLENRREDLKILGRDVTKLEAIRKPFHRMSYDQAVKNCSTRGADRVGAIWAHDETLITAQFDSPS